MSSPKPIPANPLGAVILHLDREGVDASLVCRSLQSAAADFRLDQRAQAESAEEDLRAGAYDLILYSLGDACDAQALERVRDAAPRVPVLLLADGQRRRYVESLLDSARGDGMDCVDPRGGELMHRLRAALRRRRLEIELDRTLAELGRMNHRQHAILSCARDAVLGVDANGRILFANSSAERLLSNVQAQLAGQDIHSFFRPEVVAEIAWVASPRSRRRRRQRPYQRDNIELLTVDGDARWVHLRAQATYDADGTVNGGVFVLYPCDDGATVRQQQRLAHLARNDALTGLANRGEFHQVLSAEFERAQELSSGLAVLFIDLDHFKDVNDSFGHSVGDELLSAVARRLAHCVRQGDMVARLGGDEFAVLLTGLHAARDATRVANGVVEAFQQPFTLQRHEVVMTASIGMAVCPDDANDIRTLLRAADLAMYQVKANGRNGFASAEHFRGDFHARRNGLEADLRDALAHDGLSVAYQPQVDALSGELVAIEALARWCRADGSYVAPGKFIPLAEESGLISCLGRWILRSACEQLRRWQERGLVGEAARVAVNVSVRQLRDESFVDTVSDVLLETGLCPEHLELEITESVVMDRPGRALASLSAFADLGVGLAIDDFGVGYSSLSYLKSLPVKTLKVDRSFVADVTANPDLESIVDAIIALGRKLSLHVVAEGVETEAQVALLRRLGCHTLQGFHLCRPKDAVALEEEFLRLHFEQAVG